MAELLALACLLALDTLRVTVALGAAGAPRSLDRRLAGSFAVFEAAAPVVGFAAGATVAATATAVAAVTAPVVLVAYGVSVLLAPGRTNATTTRRLVLVLPLSLSLDNMLAGAALGMLGVSIVAAAPLLGVVSGATALLGLRIGRIASTSFGRRAEVVAAVALVVLAVGVVAEG